MKRRVWGVLLILLMICLACSQVNEYVDMAKDGTISKEYLGVLHTWTRDKTVYSQFETRVHIVATYKSREFKTAYLDEYSKVYLLTESETKLRQQVLSDLSSDFTEFLFYAYTPDKDSNDFSEADSIWEVFLMGGEGDKIYPVEVRSIEKVTPVIETFFPYVKQYYGTFYSLKFSPLSPPFDEKQLKLVFTSALGRVELEWNRM